MHLPLSNAQVNVLLTRSYQKEGECSTTVSVTEELVLKSYKSYLRKKGNTPIEKKIELSKQELLNRPGFLVPQRYNSPRQGGKRKIKISSSPLYIKSTKMPSDRRTCCNFVLMSSVEWCHLVQLLMWP